MELATRQLLGYPGCKVELHMEIGDSFEVIITDPIGNTIWRPETRAMAKDMYFHPFAFGYTAPFTDERDGADDYAPYDTEPYDQAAHA